jgi:two-component system chemotaxis response regulator CheY
MKSCLIVDDSQVIRTVARKILEKLDFQIEEATGGKAALEACRRHMPDAVLLDWNMPVMDGIEFLNELRTNVAGGQEPVVVFCSTETDMERIREAMRAGANEYIMKPFDGEILESKFAQTGLL